MGDRQSRRWSIPRRVSIDQGVRTPAPGIRIHRQYNRPFLRRRAGTDGPIARRAVRDPGQLSRVLHIDESRQTGLSRGGKSYGLRRAPRYTGVVVGEVAWRDILFAEFHDILPGSGVPTAERDSLQMLSHAREILRRQRARSLHSLICRDNDAAPDEVPVSSPTRMVLLYGNRSNSNCNSTAMPGL